MPINQRVSAVHGLASYLVSGSFLTTSLAAGVFKSVFLEDGPRVFFFFNSHKTMAAEYEPELPVPQIRVHNYPISRGKGYSCSLDFSRLGDEPSLEIMQVGFDEGAKQSIVKQWQVIMEK